MQNELYLAVVNVTLLIIANFLKLIVGFPFISLYIHFVCCANVIQVVKISTLWRNSQVLKFMKAFRIKTFKYSWYHYNSHLIFCSVKCFLFNLDRALVSIFLVCKLRYSPLSFCYRVELLSHNVCATPPLTSPHGWVNRQWRVHTDCSTTDTETVFSYFGWSQHHM